MVSIHQVGRVSTISEPHKATVIKIFDPTWAIVVKIHYYATGRTQRLSVYDSEFVGKQ